MNGSSNSTHYYGDVVRKLFVFSAVFMLATLPFFTKYTPVSTQISLLIILILDIIAGITNPRQKWGAFLDTFVASLGLIGFGYYSVNAYLVYGINDLYFWVNQVLSVVFLFSLYFCIKTLRGFYVPE